MIECLVLPKGRRACQIPPISSSMNVMAGGRRGSSTHAASTCSFSCMPRQRRGTFTLEVQRVSGGASRSALKNSCQSFRSLSISKLLTPHHFMGFASFMSSADFRLCARSCAPWDLARLKTDSIKFSARGTVNSKFAISVWKVVFDLLLISTSMLSVAVASCSAYFAARRVKMMVPMSATRLTILLTVASAPSSYTLWKPAWPQPPQHGGCFPNFPHIPASVDQAMSWQNVRPTLPWRWAAHVSQDSNVHCDSMGGALMQNCCIFPKCSSAMLRSIHAKNVSRPVTKDRNNVSPIMIVDVLTPAFAERSDGGIGPAEQPTSSLPTKSSISCEGYFPKKSLKLARLRHALPVMVNWPTATSLAMCLRRCLSR
mmetsp:Transcript_36068/g.81494  ORF Transcript_36068/g.81494 Transcript_36068/m.81494 type:complete len:371 (+) Transcript_36068:1259-2371(+)